jgi:hypothetical protein
VGITSLTLRICCARARFGYGDGTESAADFDILQTVTAACRSKTTFPDSSHDLRRAIRKVVEEW